MKRENERSSTQLVRVGRWAAVVLAAGAASASTLAAGGAAGASTQGAKVTIVKTSKGQVLSDGKTVYTLKASSTPCTSVVPEGLAGSGLDRWRQARDRGFWCHHVQAREREGARCRSPGDVRRQAAVPVLW